MWLFFYIAPTAFTCQTLVMNDSSGSLYVTGWMWHLQKWLLKQAKDAPKRKVEL